MNPSARTMAFAGVAALCAITAYFSYQSTQPSDLGGYSEVGSEFFPDFEDAAKATSLTVMAYDGDTGDPIPFKVEQNDDGLWVIPSHHNYPAEAKDRLARTATSLLGVKKTAVAGRLEEDWKRFGVIDPAADVSATEEQRGTRLTLSDSSGNPLVDLIVGKSVEDRPSHYYVREPEKKTTYISELDVDLSAKFSDWIEPDLLKLSSNDIVKLVLDNYSVDEQRGAVLKKEVLEFAKADLKTSGDWELSGLDAEKEELDKSPITSIATNLDQLKIVGVRPKPEGLSDDLRVPPQVKQLLKDELERAMRSQGYFIGADESGQGERLYGNEGELIAGTDNGVQYTLYFGEIARGTGKDIEVGLSKDTKAADGEKSETDGDEAAEDEEDGPRRYLLVKVELNEELLGDKPVAPVEPTRPDILKEDDKPADAKEGNDEAENKEAGADNEAPEAAKEEAKADDGSCGPFDEEKPAAEEAANSKNETPEDAGAANQAAPKAESAAADEKAADPKADDPPAEEKAADAPAADDKAEVKEDDSKPADAATTPDDKKPAGAESKEDTKPEEKPAVPEKSPKELAQEAYDKAMLTYESEKRTYETDLKAWEDKLKKGQEKVDELSTRFAGWYYVISSDSFEKFRITRNDVVSKKEEEKPEEATPGSGN